MRRSKCSFKSLSPSSSASAEYIDTQRSRTGLRSMRASSSSLHLQGLAVETPSLPSLYSQPSTESIETPSCPATAVAASPLEETGGKTLVQGIVLFAMALQIPSLFDEIAEIVQLNVQSFPLLIVLGVVPSIYLRFSRKLEDAIDEPLMLSLSSSSLPTSPTATLSEIEQYYRNHPPQHERDEDSVPATATEPPASVSSEDQWGHFTDFDDHVQEQDINFFSSSSVSNLSQLGPLCESEDEE